MAKPGGMFFQFAQATVLAGSVLAALAWASAARRPSPRRYVFATLLSLAVPSGFALLLSYSVGGAGNIIYPPFADYAAGWRKLESISPPGGTRIAYAGTNLPYYLMAARLRNEVFYINIDAHPDWLLHNYHLSAQERGDQPVWDTPRPGWDRIHPDYRAWLENLRSKKIQLLVVAQANPQDGRFNIYDSDSFPIERFWAEMHSDDFERALSQRKSRPEILDLSAEVSVKMKVFPNSATDRAARRH